MKKILIATTMLVGTAGFAAAEVTLSGSARMGVVYNEANAGNEVAFNSRARVQFNLSGESDSGLSFGASFRADNAVGANDGQAGSVFISGAFGRLSMGDVSSAAENAVGDLVGVGYTGIGDHNEMVYIATGDNEMALYEYSAGGFTLYASVGQPDNTAPTRGDLLNSADTTYSLAAKYSTDTFTVSLGYEDVGAVDHIIGGASATFSGVTVEGIYGRASDIDFDQYGIGVSYTADALTLAAYYRETDTRGTQADFFGIGASYDLGGGATLAGGVADANGTTKADLGINLSF